MKPWYKKILDRFRTKEEVIGFETYIYSSVRVFPTRIDEYEVEIPVYRKFNVGTGKTKKIYVVYRGMTIKYDIGYWEKTKKLIEDHR